MAKILTPTITIFDARGKADLEGNKKIIDHLVRGGVDGALVQGSTGEFMHFTLEERAEYLRFYMEYTAGRMELMAGTGCMNQEDTIALSNAAFDMGYEHCAVIAPYYFAMDQNRIFHYYDRVAKGVKGKLYIYNYPPRTGHSVDPETIRALVDANPNIVGLKDSVAETGHTNMVFRALEGRPFTVYSGFDDHFMLNVANGGGGGICAMSNAMPELWSDMVRSFNTGDQSRCLKLYGLILKLMPIYSVDPTCAAIMRYLLRHRGLNISDNTPSPFDQMGEANCRAAAERMDAVIREYRALGGECPDLSGI